MEGLIYLLKVTACTVLFFGFYLLFLRKLTFFKINRFYLLVTLLLSFIIPALQFEVEREIVVANTEIPMEVPEIKPVNPAPVQLIQPVVMEYDQQEVPDVDWSKLAYYAYVIIASLLLAICLYRLFNLLKHTKGYTQNNDGLKLVPKTKGFTNCSFFNYVFIDESALTDTDLVVLLKHEQVHAKQYHSIDKIILMVFKSILWFNPIVYLYDKALEQVHEYEADEITSNGFGNQAYANLLLKLAISKSDMPLIHNFVKSPIKDRIKMLFHSKSENMKKLMYLLALPVALGLFWLFAVQVVYAQTVPKDKTKKNKELALPNVKQTDPYFSSAEYLEKIKLADEVSGKTLEGTVGEYYKADKKNQMVNGVIFVTDKYKLILTSGYTPNRGFEELKQNDKLEVKVSGTYFAFKNEPYIGIIPETIKKDGKVIYQKPKPEVYPFLYEGNRVRYNDGIISSIAKVGGKKIINVSANGFDFKITVDNTQTDLANFNGYKRGEEVRLRFVHEVKTGARSYAITDWVSISKNIRTFGVQNNKLFSRFYFSDGKQKVAAVKEKLGIVPEAVKSKVISFAKMKGDVGTKIYYMDNAVMEVLNHRLEAEYIAFDKVKNKIIAKNGTLKSLDGKSVIKATAFDLDLNKGLFRSKNPEGEYHAINLEDLENKKENLVSANDRLTYSAEDSVKTSRDRSVITLYGKARFGNDNFSVLADEVTINNSTKTVAAKNLTLTNKNSGITITGYYGEFDMKGKLEIWQDNK